MGALPHKFKDGVAEVASGVQVTENDQYLLEQVEAVVDKASKYTPRSETLFSKKTIKEAENSTWTNPSATQMAWLNLDFQVHSEGARGEAGSIYVGGVLVTYVYANENNGTYFVRSTAAVLVGPGETVEITCYAGGGGTQVAEINGSYRLFAGIA